MIQNLSFTQSEHSRTEAIAFIQNAIPVDIWTSNTELVKQFRVEIDQHALFEQYFKKSESATVRSTTVKNNTYQLFKLYQKNFYRCPSTADFSSTTVGK
jgi:hypothetical protein